MRRNAPWRMKYCPAHYEDGIKEEEEGASEYHFSPLENSPKVWPNSRLIVDRGSKKEHSPNCAIYIRLLSPIDNNQEPYDDRPTKRRAEIGNPLQSNCSFVLGRLRLQTQLASWAKRAQEICGGKLEEQKPNKILHLYRNVTILCKWRVQPLW